MTNIDDLDIALEGMFSDPEVTVAGLLDQVKAGLTAKNATIADCDQLIQNISNEAVKFNDCIRQLTNAMRDFRAQNISADQFKEIAEPCCAQLRKNSTALGMVNCCTNDCDISENEIAVLKEFLIGAKNAVEEYKASLKDEPAADKPSDTNLDGTDTDDSPAEATEAMESEINNLLGDEDGYEEEEDDDNDADDFANEGLIASILNGDEPALESGGAIARQLRKSTKAKTAVALYKQAKKLNGMGATQKAIATMKQAQRLYESLLSEAKAKIKVKKVHYDEKFSAGVISRTSIGASYDREEGSGASTIKYFADRVDACKAYIIKWDTKSNKFSVKELKNKLKDERKGIKDEKKTAKAAAKANESFDLDEDLEEIALEAEFLIMRLEDGYDENDI